MFEDGDFEVKEACPWCESKRYTLEYIGKYNVPVLRCKDCGLVYSKKILNSTGLNKYWSHYESQVHSYDEQAVNRRKIMYKVEKNYILNFMSDKKSILDIGCGDGSFMDLFSEEGYSCIGVEYGKEAAEIASQKHKVYLGDFIELEIKEKFDLIIFRGTIQYMLKPKKYLEKAINLLNDNGMIFITSSPNANSFCFKLFKENFSLPVSVTDYYAFNENLLSDFFYNAGLVLLDSKWFYKETPYADICRDENIVKKALECKKMQKKIDFPSPPFYDTMLSLVYKKL